MWATIRAENESNQQRGWPSPERVQRQWSTDISFSSHFWAKKKACLVTVNIRVWDDNNNSSSSSRAAFSLERRLSPRETNGILINVSVDERERERERVSAELCYGLCRIYKSENRRRSSSDLDADNNRMSRKNHSGWRTPPRLDQTFIKTHFVIQNLFFFIRKLLQKAWSPKSTASQNYFVLMCFFFNSNRFLSFISMGQPCQQSGGILASGTKTEVRPTVRL